MIPIRTAIPHHKGRLVECIYFPFLDNNNFILPDVCVVLDSRIEKNEVFLEVLSQKYHRRYKTPAQYITVITKET